MEKKILKSKRSNPINLLFKTEFAILSQFNR